VTRRPLWVLAWALGVLTVAMVVWQAFTTGRIEQAGGCGFDGEQYCGAARAERIAPPYSRRPLVPLLVRALRLGSVLDRFLVVDLVALAVAAWLVGVLVLRLAGEASRSRALAAAVVAGCLVLLQPLTVHAAIAYPAQTDSVALALALAWLALLLGGRPWLSLPVAVLLVLARESWGPVVVAVVVVDALLDRSRWRLAVVTSVAALGAVAVDLVQPFAGTSMSAVQVVKTWLRAHVGSGGGLARLFWMTLTGLGLVPLLLVARSSWRVPRRPLALLATAALANAVLAVVGGNDTARLLLPTMAVALALALAAVARAPRLDLPLVALAVGCVALWRPWTVAPTDVDGFLAYFTPYYSSAQVFNRRLLLDGVVALAGVAGCALTGVRGARRDVTG
jgi:hypothetical protein